jgi:hypothetical protein
MLPRINLSPGISRPHTTHRRLKGFDFIADYLIRSGLTHFRLLADGWFLSNLFRDRYGRHRVQSAKNVVSGLDHSESLRDTLLLIQRDGFRFRNDLTCNFPQGVANVFCVFH